MIELEIDIGKKANPIKTRKIPPPDDFLVVGYSGGCYVAWQGDHYSILFADKFEADPAPARPIPALAPSLDDFLFRMKCSTFHPSRTESQPVTGYVTRLAHSLTDHFGLGRSSRLALINRLFDYDRSNIPKQRHAVFAPTDADGLVILLDSDPLYNHHTTMARLTEEFVFESHPWGEPT